MAVQNRIVELKTDILFEEQLHVAIRKYSNLKIVQDDQGLVILKGVLDIPNDNKEIVGHFLIEVHRSEKFPYRFPILYETGGAIPNEANWHKYKNGSCCITVWPDEILKCKSGISVSYFIEKYAIPYFANQIHRMQTDEYKNGEYAHGVNGISQYYENLMKTGDKKLWIQYFKNTFRNLSVSNGRNDICFCGSGQKYKNCHLEVFNTLRQIGEIRILNDFSLFVK